MEIHLMIDKEAECEEKNGDDRHSQLGFMTNGICSR
jgi:hypothetical protein